MNYGRSNKTESGRGQPHSKTLRKSLHAGGFTLIELLVVIAIIVILAAMLLPVLNRGKMRAKQIQCVNNLREMGLAFNSFAHDHESRFPMQVSTNSGGAMEFVQRGYLTTGEFYFTFRIFQTISNELVAAKHLSCPSDTRGDTNTFANVNNANLSYFVGVNAQPGATMMVLAGDRNIHPEMVPPVSIYHLYNTFLEWSREGHRFKGNLLFADSHVEQTKSPVLRQDVNQNSRMADVFMPSVKGVGASTSGGPGGGGGGGGGSGGSGGGGSGGGGTGSSGSGGSGGSGASTPPSQPHGPNGAPAVMNAPAADKPAMTPPWNPAEKQTRDSTRAMAGAHSSGSDASQGLMENKTPFTNHSARVSVAKTNAVETNTNDSVADPIVAAAPHYLAQGNNWLLWLLVLLIALFLMVLEIRRRMDATAKKKSRFGTPQ